MPFVMVVISDDTAARASQLSSCLLSSLSLSFSCLISRSIVFSFSSCIFSSVKIRLACNLLDSSSLALSLAVSSCIVDSNAHKYSPVASSRLSDFDDEVVFS